VFPGLGARSWWKAACEKAGLPTLRFGDLRKIAWARMQQKLPLAQVTADHYTPLDPSVRRRLDELPLP